MHFLILLVSLFFVFAKQERNQLVITQYQVVVKGHTSVGKFNCNFEEKGKVDTLDLNASDSQDAMEFQIPVKSFSCGNFLLNSDFRSTLKAEEYPFAKVQVKNLREKSGAIYCHLSLHLVGNNLEYPDFLLKKNAKGLRGKLILDFETLNLTPPRKLGGLIKVEDKLDLELQLGI